LNNLHRDISDLKNSFNYGNVIKKGVPVAIAGKPNVGKSSLLNALFDEEKAIVSNIPGTTRDTIEDTLILDGILFRFIDTAGLRETNDTIEAIGVERAREKVKKASVLIYLYQNDTDAKIIANEIQGLMHKGLCILLVENKIDLNQNSHSLNLANEIESVLEHESDLISIGISTKNASTLKPLKNHLVTVVQNMKSESNLIIHNSRHFHALSEALKAIETIQDGLDHALPGDLLSIDLKEAIHHIGSITGNIDNDQDILGAIFSQFCIGK
jgi:tRNA modification GTPase